jgi:arylsulfatase A-like enzyme
MKRLMLGLLVVLLLATGGFFAAGGVQGLILLYVKHVLHTEAAPTTAVRWEQAPAAAAVDGQRPPNILLIVVDDLGYNDITLNGGGVAGDAVPTPNIDSIAQNGVNFTSGYAGNATCSPSRAAMMTGRYPTRFGAEFTSAPISFSRVIARFKSNGLHPAIFHEQRAGQMIPFEDMGVPTSEIMIPRLLGQAGYHNLHLGKWHNGENASMGPNAHGFDETLGFLQGGMMFLEENDPRVVNAQQDFDPIDKFLWAAAPFGVSFNNGPAFKPPVYVTDYFTDEALQAIKANKQRPFFMYLSYNAPHTPLQATREDYDALPQIKDHTRRVYAAMIRNLDRNIGRVLQELKDQGLYDNTLVIFTSDNGGAHYIGLDDLNKPYRGWKATFFEGGIRVPFFMQWPGVIPAGSTFSEPVSHFDIFATSAAVAGVTPPADLTIDGVNLLPFVTGSQAGKPHEELFWRSGVYRVLRAGDWKLQVNPTRGKVWLFNLEEDPTEQHDLAGSEPGRVQQMLARLEAFNSQQRDPLWPSMLEAPVLVDKPLNRAVSADDEFIFWSN